MFQTLLKQGSVSYVIQLNTAEKMRTGKLDVIYIVPTLSLLNQVVEDYHTLLTQVGGIDYIITSNLTVGESKADHTIYVWTQEKAISGLSDQTFGSMPNKTVLVVDEVQNIERVTDENDVRSKILYDILQELLSLFPMPHSYQKQINPSPDFHISLPMCNKR